MCTNVLNFFQAQADQSNHHGASELVSACTQAQSDTSSTKENTAHSMFNPRAFSKEETNMSSHCIGRNNVQSVAWLTLYGQQTQARQAIPLNGNYPEMNPAVLASSDQQLPQSFVLTSNIIPSTLSRKPASILSKCAVCEKKANFLCSGCQNMYYCTVQCQVGSTQGMHFYMIHIFFRRIIGWLTTTSVQIKK